MTHHDKARGLVEIGVIWLREIDMHDEADAITAQAEENRRLREALQPFADVAEHDIGSDEADCDAFRPMFGVNRAPYLMVGDLRRARVALSSTGEK